LLDFLERRASSTGATPQQIREAVDLAVSLSHEDRAEALLVRAVNAARDTVDGIAGAPWSVLALAERQTLDRTLTNDLGEFVLDLDATDTLRLCVGLAQIGTFTVLPPRYAEGPPAADDKVSPSTARIARAGRGSDRAAEKLRQPKGRA